MPSLEKTVAAFCSTARIAGALGIALAGVVLLVSPPAHAAEPFAFVIPAEDGYGIADCMQAGSACGQAMATSWCEAHGHPHVAAFGLSDDVTGSVPGAEGTVTPGALVIRCGD